MKILYSGEVPFYLLCITMSGCSSWFRHRTYNISIDWSLNGQLTSTLHSHRIYHLSLKYWVWSGKVYIFEYTKSLFFVGWSWHYVNSSNSISSYLDNFTRFNLLIFIFFNSIYIQYLVKYTNLPREHIGHQSIRIHNFRWIWPTRLHLQTQPSLNQNELFFLFHSNIYYIIYLRFPNSIGKIFPIQSGLLPYGSRTP